MIMKEKAIPFKLIGLEALVRRLSKSHPRYTEMENKVRITRAGVRGEKLLSSVFEKYHFHGEHYIFHDLNLQSSGMFQIDALVVSTRGAVILEMKNIAGDIYFPEERNQLIRTLGNGQVDMFECPSVQLARNKMLLEDWFHGRNLSIPVYGAVVFPRPQQIFENIRNNLKILFPLEIPVYLREIEENPPSLDAIALQTVVHELSSAHREYNPFPLCHTYKIHPNELQTGVHCKTCESYGMIPIHKGWGCRRCGAIDREAHQKALLDYFMLVAPCMKNKDVRRFLHVESYDKVRRLLTSAGIPFSGERRGRIYCAGLEEIERLWMDE